MIEINGQIYRFNLSKMVEFFNYSEVNKSQEREILDNYETDDNGKLTAAGKSVRELVSTGNGQMDNIKYDLLKTLITPIITYGYNDEIEQQNIEEMPIGVKICFNTLLKEGMLERVIDE